MGQKMVFHRDLLAQQADGSETARNTRALTDRCTRGVYYLMKSEFFVDGP